MTQGTGVTKLFLGGGFMWAESCDRLCYCCQKGSLFLVRRLYVPVIWLALSSAAGVSFPTELIKLGHLICSDQWNVSTSHSMPAPWRSSENWYLISSACSFSCLGHELAYSRLEFALCSWLLLRTKRIWGADPQLIHSFRISHTT